MLLPKSLWILLASLMSSCTPPETIHDETLSDRVIACGCGFSDDLLTSLLASASDTKLEGSVNADFRLKAKQLIFDEFDPQDRIKAYEEYIRCLEGLPPEEEKPSK